MFHVFAIVEKVWNCFMKKEKIKMECYHTVYTEGTGEIVEKISRFIAEVFPVSNEEEAFAHVEEIRKKHWDARHHCWAYVIGRNPAAERMSDDGEPAGTAGKPILEVLRGKKLTDVFVVVTRYVGGTLLGTGGLVRAYTSAAAEASIAVATASSKSKCTSFPTCTCLARCARAHDTTAKRSKCATKAKISATFSI